MRRGSLGVSTHAAANRTDPRASAFELAGPVSGALVAVSAFDALVRLEGLGCAGLFLWGCEVHGTGAQRGEEWLGLTRSLLAAGRTLVASLWPIDHAVTLLVSYRFCRGLQAGLTVPQALRKAMGEVRGVTRGTVREWVREIAAVLPEADGVELTRLWEKELAGYPGVVLIPDAALSQWAPYLTIGWPGTILHAQP